MSETLKLKVDTRVVVETPEGVDFQFVIAGPGTRAYAWIIDILLKGAIFAVVYLAFFFLGFWFNNDGRPSGSLGDIGDNFTAAVMLIFTFVLDWFYGSFFEAWMNGQTPGKRSAGLRVVRTNGTPIELSSAIGRNFLRTVDMLPLLYTVGMISMLMTRRMQRLGDLVFDTMVIDERREWISRTGGLTANMEPLTRSECPRRFSVPERTLAVIERLFESDRIISEARREEISRPLSETLRRRLGYQDPQPDPRNPHTFFRTQGFRHTNFILRVLKTFAEDPTGARGALQSPGDSKWNSRGLQTDARSGKNAVGDPSSEFSSLMTDDGIRASGVQRRES